MTLADDIARIANQYSTVSAEFTDYLAAGLEREKVIIDRTELPKVKSDDPKTVQTGSGLNAVTATVSSDPEQLRATGRSLFALAAHLESHNSAEARLQERRDELARELWDYFDGTYARRPEGDQDAIDRIIAEQDARAAAEDRVNELERSERHDCDARCLP